MVSRLGPLIRTAGHRVRTQHGVTASAGQSLTGGRDRRAPARSRVAPSPSHLARRHGATHNKTQHTSRQVISPSSSFSISTLQAEWKGTQKGRVEPPADGIYVHTCCRVLVSGRGCYALPFAPRSNHFLRAATLLYRAELVRNAATGA